MGYVAIKSSKSAQRDGKNLHQNLREMELATITDEEFRNKKPVFTNIVLAVSSRLEKVMKLEQSRPATNKPVGTMTSFLRKKQQSVNNNDLMSRKYKQVLIYATNNPSSKSHRKQQMAKDSSTIKTSADS